MPTAGPRRLAPRRIRSATHAIARERGGEAGGRLVDPARGRSRQGRQPEIQGGLLRVGLAAQVQQPEAAEAVLERAQLLGHLPVAGLVGRPQVRRAQAREKQQRGAREHRGGERSQAGHGASGDPLYRVGSPHDTARRADPGRGGVMPAAAYLSVVVPVHDEEESLETLHREIDAAVGSQPGGLEIVLVDDGSRDASLARMRAIAEKDPRVRVLALDAPARPERSARGRLRRCARRA